MEGSAIYIGVWTTPRTPSRHTEYVRLITTHQISGPVIQNALEDAAETMKDLEARLLRSLSLESSVVRRMKWVQTKT